VEGGFIFLDRDWRIRDANDAAMAVIGRPRGQLIGESYWECFPEAVGSEFEAAYRRAVQEQRVETVVALSKAYGRWFQVNAYPTPEGLSLFFRDVTERREQENALRESETRFRTLVQAVPSIVWTGTAEGAVFFADQWESFTGFTAEESVGAGWVKALHPEDRERVAATWAHAVETNGIYDVEYRLRRASGDYHWVLVRAVPVHAKDGPTTWVGTVTDIHEQKVTAERLRQVEKLAAAGRLSATIAHEINNPLEAVTNLLYLLQSDPSLSEQGRRFAALADRELSRVAHITRQTLGFYKESASVSSTSLNDIVLSVLPLYEAKVRTRSIVVETQFEDGGEVQCYKGEIVQVVANFINNAIDATEPAGRITLRTSGDAEHATIEVRDTGIGIPAAQRERIFEPFFTTKKDVGTGLGLWVAKQIVDRHRGTIEVESSTHPESHGTVFRLTLPRRAANSAAA
jgi:PAS domain S-box-containing protein